MAKAAHRRWHCPTKLLPIESWIRLPHWILHPKRQHGNQSTTNWWEKDHHDHDQNLASLGTVPNQDDSQRTIFPMEKLPSTSPAMESLKDLHLDEFSHDWQVRPNLNATVAVESTESNIHLRKVEIQAKLRHFRCLEIATCNRSLRFATTSSCPSPTSLYRQSEKWDLSDVHCDEMQHSFARVGWIWLELRSPSSQLQAYEKPRAPSKSFLDGG